MSWRKKVNPKSSQVNPSFANWFSQLCMMIMPKYLYVIAGRGSSKTTDIQVERLIEMAYDMPGAPVVWVSDTYANLQKNVLNTVMEGLALKGYHKDIHYVVEKAPPKYSEAEKEDLPTGIKEHFWKPYNQLASYKHTLIFFTGLNLTYASLDRPASLAGRNYVHIFGDEAKYFREDRIANLLKAVRGYRVKYGGSVFYRGHTFTTDMPDTSRIGEYDWILKQGKKMSASAIALVLKLAIVVNESLQEYLVACEEANTEEQIKKHRVWKRWIERWIAARMHKASQTFFFIASSFVNADILTPEYFANEFESDFSDVKTAILSMKPSLESGERFYANLNERHFYRTGVDPVAAAHFGLTDAEDCRILKHHNSNRAIDAGADFGNMISLTLAQESGKTYRCTKFIYTLSPEWIRDLADKFLDFYKPHREKVLNLYYDRAANNYHKAKQDLANQLKKAIEYRPEPGNEDKLIATGWKVVLMSEGQGNIGQNEEYNFMQELLSGNNRKLPNIQIDYFACKALRCSLELTKTRKNQKGFIVKDKSSEKLPIHRLPLESTNASDSFKYLMMRRSWRRLVASRSKPYTGSTSVI